MQQFPPPHALDPHRLLVGDSTELPDNDDRANIQLLEQALRESCDYARTLWNTVDAIRHYLLHSLPSDPRSPGPTPTTSAAPTGPDDEKGWTDWIAAYASVTSVLCGPHGDAGYGLGEARRTATERRTAPNLRLYTDTDTDNHKGSDTGKQDDHSTTTTHPDPVAEKQRGSEQTPLHPQLVRGITAGLVVLLAIRALRPRHRPV